MTLQEKLDAFKADFEGNKAPPQAVAIMRRATAALIATGQAERALKSGDRAPSFALADADGKIWRSEEFWREVRWSSPSIVAYGAPIAISTFRRCRRRGADPRGRRFAGGDLAANRAQQPQGAARPRSDVSGVERPRK